MKCAFPSKRRSVVSERLMRRCLRFFAAPQNSNCVTRRTCTTHIIPRQQIDPSLASLVTEGNKEESLILSCRILFALGYHKHHITPPQLQQFIAQLRHSLTHPLHTSLSDPKAPSLLCEGLWGLARLGVQRDRLHLLLSQAIMKSSHQLQPRDVQNAVWGMARSGFTLLHPSQAKAPMTFCHKIEEAIYLDPAVYTTHALVQVCWGFATMRARIENIVRLIIPRVVVSPPHTAAFLVNCSGGDISLLVWAMGRMEMQPPQDFLYALLQAVSAPHPSTPLRLSLMPPQASPRPLSLHGTPSSATTPPQSHGSHPVKERVCLQLTHVQIARCVWGLAHAVPGRKTKRVHDTPSCLVRRVILQLKRQAVGKMEWFEPASYRMLCDGLKHVGIASEDVVDAARIRGRRLERRTKKGGRLRVSDRQG